MMITSIIFELSGGVKYCTRGEYDKFSAQQLSREYIPDFVTDYCGGVDEK